MGDYKWLQVVMSGYWVVTFDDGWLRMVLDGYGLLWMVLEDYGVATAGYGWL